MKYNNEQVKTVSLFGDLYTPAESAAMDAMAIIAAEIQLARSDLGMNQKEFAKFMGVTQGMVSRWESGDYNFTISTLASICDKIGVKISDLFIEAEQGTRIESDPEAFEIESMQIFLKSIAETRYTCKEKSREGDAVSEYSAVFKYPSFSMTDYNSEEQCYA